TRSCSTPAAAPRPSPTSRPAGRDSPAFLRTILWRSSRRCDTSIISVPRLLRNPPMTYLTAFRRLLPALVLLVTFALLPAAADDYDQLKVGVQPDGRIVVPTNQILKPAGTQVTFPGRPVDLAFADGNTLVIKNMKNLVFLDAKEGKVVQTLPLSEAKGATTKSGFSIVGLLVDGKRVYVSDAQMNVRVAVREGDKYTWADNLELTKPKEGSTHPAGLARQDKDHFWVTATRNNSVELMPAAK